MRGRLGSQRVRLLLGANVLNLCRVFDPVNAYYNAYGFSVYPASSVAYHTCELDKKGIT